MSDVRVEELAAILEEDDKWLTKNYNEKNDKKPCNFLLEKTNL